jgi:hypothetical protein
VALAAEVREAVPVLPAAKDGVGALDALAGAVAVEVAVSALLPVGAAESEALDVGDAVPRALGVTVAVALASPLEVAQSEGWGVAECVTLALAERVPWVLAVEGAVGVPAKGGVAVTEGVCCQAAGVGVGMEVAAGDCVAPGVALVERLPLAVSVPHPLLVGPPGPPRVGDTL